MFLDFIFSAVLVQVQKNMFDRMHVLDAFKAIVLYYLDLIFLQALNDNINYSHMVNFFFPLEP